MTVTVAGLRFDFVATTLTAFFMKSTRDAYYFNGSTLAKISDADYPGTTVPGVAFLDSYVFVMDADGKIYNSDLEAFTAWNPLNFITAEAEPDAGVAIAKHQNYVVALKSGSVELFYDAANASGSPLAKLSNAAIQVGCANGNTVAAINGGLAFVSRNKERGRSVHFFADGSIQPQDIGSDAVRRILNSADMTTAHWWGAKLGGQVFYVLNLVTESLTLAYDFKSGVWAQWTLLTAGSAKSVSSLTQANGLATATSTGHGFSDGDPVVMAGATPSGYNGTFNVNVIDANTFTYAVSSALATPATGTITATSWTEGKFAYSFYTSTETLDLVQSEVNGRIIKMSADYLDDSGAPINKIARNGKLDSGNTKRKTLHEVAVVGNQVAANLLFRYSDDDYQTHSKYRQVSMNQERPRMRRFGQFIRRSFDVRITDSALIRIAGLDADIEQGA